MYGNITSGSRPDYTCYTMRCGDEIVAVIIEAKLTTHSKIAHAVAQVRGGVACISGLT